MSEYDRVRTVVMIPCYNEGLTIEAVVNDFRRVLPKADIIVFDNNSTDDSYGKAIKAGARVVKEKRQGKGYVVSAMLSKVDADVYVMVDGDGTYPAESVVDLIRPLLADEADMVVGQRLSEFSPNAFRSFHVLGNQLVCGLINLVFSSSLRDPMSGYRAFTAEIALQLPIVAYGFDVETEMTIQLLYRNFVIKEVPISYRARALGSNSKLRTLRDGFLVLRKVFSIVRAYKPLAFFGGLGIVSVAVGVLVGLFAVRQYNHIQVNYVLACAGVSVACVFAGIILGAVGLVIHTLNFRLLELSSTVVNLGHRRVAEKMPRG